MNSTEIFALALGLKAPWEITDIEISVDKDSIKELNIHLGCKRGATFDDETRVRCSVHDTQKRTWHHLNFFEHSCHLHCAVLRIRTNRWQGTISTGAMGALRERLHLAV